MAFKHSSLGPGGQLGTFSQLPQTTVKEDLLLRKGSGSSNSFVSYVPLFLRGNSEKGV